jgi:hypothetical protein
MDQLVMLLIANLIVFLIGFYVGRATHKAPPNVGVSTPDELDHVLVSVQDRMEELMKGLAPPEDGQRVPVREQDIEELYRKMGDRSPHGHYLMWSWLGKLYPVTLVGNWRIDSSDLHHPAIVETVRERTKV